MEMQLAVPSALVLAQGFHLLVPLLVLLGAPVGQLPQPP